MKKLLLSLMLMLGLTAPSLAATYYISPTGSDSNSGTVIGSPWLSPNHALNCGDVIMGAAGSYSAANFQNGKWGTAVPAGITSRGCSVQPSTRSPRHPDTHAS
jgi:type 1 fimbria pilin